MISPPAMTRAGFLHRTDISSSGLPSTAMRSAAQPSRTWPVTPPKRAISARRRSMAAALWNAAALFGRFSTGGVRYPAGRRLPARRRSMRTPVTSPPPLVLPPGGADAAQDAAPGHRHAALPSGPRRDDSASPPPSPSPVMVMALWPQEAALWNSRRRSCLPEGSPAPVFALAFPSRSATIEPYKPK